MKATCTLENFKRALFTLERVVGKQNSLPILSTILIETEKGQLKLSATNLEIGVITKIGAKIEEEGGLTVPAKPLHTFIYNLSLDQILEIHQESGALSLQSGKNHIRIKGMESKDFPIIPHFEGEYPLSLPAQAFREALQKVLFAVSLNESRIELTGVQFLLEEYKLAVAATDSFRLAEYTLSLSKEVIQKMQNAKDQYKQLLIPTQTLQEILRLIQDTTEEVSLVVSENQLFFLIDGVQVVSRLLQGQFPEYRQIIPKQFLSTITLQKEELLQVLKMASSFSVLSANEVKLSLSQDQQEITFTTIAQDIGENTSRVSFQGTLHEDMEILFNPRYLLEGVAALPNQEIVFQCNSSQTPALLKSAEESFPYYYLIMPIKK